jgi:hypothetical protein
MYAFASNFVTASLAASLPFWNKEFPQDRRSFNELAHFQSVREPHPLFFTAL